MIDQDQIASMSGAFVMNSKLIPRFTIMYFVIILLIKLARENKVSDNFLILIPGFVITGFADASRCCGEGPSNGSRIRTTQVEDTDTHTAIVASVIVDIPFAVTAPVVLATPFDGNSPGVLASPVMEITP